MTLQEVVARFNTTPFLFAGSGITRRYYGLPDWKGLLQEFSHRINKDRFAFRAYESKAAESEPINGLLPRIATLLQQDFDEAWYKSPEIRTLSEAELALVENGASPFKVEVAAFLKKRSSVLPKFQTEVGKLKAISKKNIAGVITTNYDFFFEHLFSDYKTFVGQDELVFSAIQGIAEIYKIHGSVSNPESIVITEKDYTVFNDKGRYLAAKLMTIFMEYPIIFIGYSLTDKNIQNILSDIVVCLPESKIASLQERFVFVEYDENTPNVVVSTHSIDLGGKLIQMTKLTLSDFGILYHALAAKKAALPLKLLRRFQEDIYTYAITREPGPLLQVANIDDEHINDEQLVISIGISKNGEYGFKLLVDDNKWYRNVITDEFRDLGYPYDQLLEFAYPEIVKSLNGHYPVCKYLANAQKSFPDIESTVPKTFDELATKTNLKNRRATEKYKSVQDLWEQEHTNPERMYRLLAAFPEVKMDAEQLGKVLQELFDSDKEALSNNPRSRADIKRLIRMYDYLNWKK